MGNHEVVGCAAGEFEQLVDADAVLELSLIHEVSFAVEAKDVTEGSSDAEFGG